MILLHLWSINETFCNGRNVSLIIKLVNDTPHHHMSRDVTSHSPVTRHTPEYGGGDIVADVTLGCLMSRWLLPAVQSPVPGVMWHWADLALAEWCRGSVEARAQPPEFGLVRTESVTGSASGGCVWSTRVQPDSPHRQETSLEGWGCYPPNLNIMALNNISCTLTNIARTTRQFKQSHVMS